MKVKVQVWDCSESGIWFVVDSVRRARAVTSACELAAMPRRQ